MNKLSLVTACVVALLSACSSNDGSSSTTSSGGASSGGASSGGTSSGGTSSGGTSADGCTVTFGGDASTVKATNCKLMGPFVSDATAFTFTGDAQGLDAPIYAYTVKYPNGITPKTYQTADLFYVSENMSVTSTGKIYDVDYDSKDATKERHGSVTTTFTSDKHGTIDIVMDSDDTPPAHATVHITF